MAAEPADNHDSDFEPAVLADLSGPEDAREACWLRLHRHYTPRLTSYLARRVPRGHTVEEVVVEVWRRVFLKIGTLRSSRAMWSWLTTIGNNLLADLRRRQNVRDRREILFTDASNDDALERALASWATINIGVTQEALGSQLLRQLTQEEREFLELFAVDGLSHEELARRLNLPSAAASRQRLRRLRERMARRRHDGQ